MPSKSLISIFVVQGVRGTHPHRVDEAGRKWVQNEPRKLKLFQFGSKPRSENDSDENNFDSRVEKEHRRTSTGWVESKYVLIFSYTYSSI